ncbi:MAG: prepilin-type N-terminal cleavage/methylation domain-containing protein [Patescibacteria group bacterium]
MSGDRWRLTRRLWRAVRRGFTLIEIVVVMGIAAAIAAMGVGLGLGSAAKNICHTEFNLLHGAILRARNLAATSAKTDENIVAIFDENEIKIFADGDNGDVLLESFLLSEGFVATSSSEFFPENRVEFVIDKSGVRSSEASLGLSGPACNQEIKINHVGAII